MLVTEYCLGILTSGQRCRMKRSLNEQGYCRWHSRQSPRDSESTSSTSDDLLTFRVHYGDKMVSCFLKYYQPLGLVIKNVCEYFDIPHRDYWLYDENGIYVKEYLACHTAHGKRLYLRNKYTA